MSNDNEVVAALGMFMGVSAMAVTLGMTLLVLALYLAGAWP